MAVPTPAIIRLSSANLNTNDPRKPTAQSRSHPLSLLPKCIYLKELKQFQAQSVKTLLNSTYVFAKIIEACTIDPTPSSMEYAHHLFGQIPQPDILCFNLMARGYSRSGTPLRAFVLFTQILCLGLLPDCYTFPSLLKSCARAKALEQGKQLHCFFIKLGFGHDDYVFSSLINMYTQCNDMGSARLAFDRIQEPCVTTYNAIITGYVRNSQPNEALSFFREMQKKNLKPTDVTMLSIVSACSLLGALDLGRWVHYYVKKNHFDRYVKVNTALIDMYAKCGSLDEAVSVFRGMGFRDTEPWNAMIMAYAIHGHGKDALNMFEEMKTAETRPDEITFLGLLCACNHSGMIEKGFEFFNLMKEEYKIVPQINHYGCVLDLLARAGRLDDAYSFIKSMPIEPTPILWRTLLAACGSHGNFAMGKKVINRIFEMDKTHGGDYMIFVNLCAKAGEFEALGEIRAVLKNRGIRKLPGCSSIELGNTVHEFFSCDGDERRAEYRELRLAVDELVKELKRFGYVPDTSLVCRSEADMGEEEKEKALRYHSEKMAIVYGLLNTPSGTPIRVVKNVRICRDCHSAAKVISFVYGRRIVLRDVQRFHHFENGECSCGDYW